MWYRKRNYRVVDPEVQNTIVARFVPSDSVNGLRPLAREFNLPKSTVEHIITRASSNNGDPVQPRGHKRRRLTSAEERKVCARVDKNPNSTNRQLAHLVDNKVVPRTISDVLARANPPVVRKVFVDQEPEETSANWKATMKHFIEKTLRHIPLNTRIYADETAIYANEAPTMGRIRKGEKLLRRKEGMPKSIPFTYS